MLTLAVIIIMTVAVIAVTVKLQDTRHGEVIGMAVLTAGAMVSAGALYAAAAAGIAA